MLSSLCPIQQGRVKPSLLFYDSQTKISSTFTWIGETEYGWLEGLGANRIGIGNVKKKKASRVHKQYLECSSVSIIELHTN